MSSIAITTTALKAMTADAKIATLALVTTGPVVDLAARRAYRTVLNQAGQVSNIPRIRPTKAWSRAVDAAAEAVATIMILLNQPDHNSLSRYQQTKINCFKGGCQVDDTNRAIVRGVVAGIREAARRAYTNDTELGTRRRVEFDLDVAVVAPVITSQANRLYRSLTEADFAERFSSSTPAAALSTSIGA